jgi:hypothetical protein
MLCVSSYYSMCPHTTINVSSYCSMCVVILPTRPHCTTQLPRHSPYASSYYHVSSYYSCYYRCSHTPHTTMHVSSCHSHYYICALIQLTLVHMPPHTAHTSPRCRLSQRCAAASTRAKRTPSSSSTRAARSVLHFLALPLLGFRV